MAPACFSAAASKKLTSKATVGFLALALLRATVSLSQLLPRINSLLDPTLSFVEEAPPSTTKMSNFRLSSDPQVLLRFMDELDSDCSDGDFDGYVESKLCGFAAKKM